MSAGIGTTPPESKVRLPKLALLTLFAAGFLAVLTESLPAGLLPEIGSSLALSDSATGQILTVYALGTAVGALPLTVLTSSWDRRSVLLAAVAAFLVANTVTVFSDNYALIIAVRIVAGLAAGLIWSIIGGYAQRLVHPDQEGRALSIATAGTPAALALGIPAGIFLGSFGGWRVAFLIITAISLVVLVLTLWRMPRVAGTAKGTKIRPTEVIRQPGLRIILTVVALFALAHNVMYTYIAPLLALRGISDQIEWLLLAFGLAALVSIYVTGRLIDMNHRRLTVVSLGGLALVAAVFSIPVIQGGTLYGVAVIWGLAYGGTPALFLTAAGRAGGKDAGVAQAMMVTVWNIGITFSGVVGGVALAQLGAGSIGPISFVVAIPALLIAVAAQRYGFPARRPETAELPTR